MTYKTKYVPVDAPKAICNVYKIMDSFKDPVYINVNNLPDVETDDDIELLAKTALDDVLSLDKAHQDLVGEANRLEAQCAKEKEAADAERVLTLESIDELNKP